MKKVIVFGAALFAAALSLTSTVSAQQCECVDGVKCYVLPDGTLECDPNIKCEGAVVVNPPIPNQPKEPVNSEVRVEKITASFNSKALGQVNIQSTDGAPISSITSTDASSVFPLTVQLNFNAEARIESLPGQVFRSSEPLTYATKSANSVSPFKEEKLVLQNSVAFVNDDGKPVFKLEAGSSSIVLGPNRD